MDTIFMNSENSNTSMPHVLILNLTFANLTLLNLTDKIDLRRGEKVLLYQVLVFTLHGKTQKAHAAIINLKYQLQYRVMNLNCKMDRILYQIFKFILSIF